MLLAPQPAHPKGGLKTYTNQLQQIPLPGITSTQHLV